MDCIFCKLVNGEIPSSKIYEDGDLIAFLDIKPVNPGHALIIPKAHHATYAETPKELIAEMMTLVPDIANAILEATGAPAFNIMVNNGRVAGQLVDHVHIHIIPRKENDGNEAWHGTEYASIDEMNALANTIRASI